MEPISGSVFSGLNTTFKLAEFGLKLADASEDNRFFCKLIERVRKDRVEALRERREKSAALKSQPAKKEWIDGTIYDCEEALQVIGNLVETARVDQVKGRNVTLKHRFEWVLKKKEAFLTKQSHLATCHRSLTIAIIYMQSLSADPIANLNSLPKSSSLSLTSEFGPSSAPPAYPVYEDLNADGFILRPPAQRRPHLQREYVLPITTNVVEDPESFSADWQRALETNRQAEKNSIILSIQEEPRPSSSSAYERRRRNEARFIDVD